MPQSIGWENSPYLGTWGLAIVLFATTNIDDIFVLISFFADPKYRVRHVVIGQYVGIMALVAVSILTSLVSLVLAPAYVGFLGLFPILIGLNKFADLRSQVADENAVPLGGLGNVLSVAAVTIANGGDNIGVYTPIFATSNSTEIAIITFVFALMVAAWLASSHWLVNHPSLGAPIRRYGHRLVPFVLVGIGAYVLFEAGSISLLIQRSSDLFSP